MPLKNAKKKGTRNEHKSMANHTSRGAVCLRAGASLGLFDFVALYADHAELVQVKSNRWPGHEEMHGLRSFTRPDYAICRIERWDDYAREPKVREIE